MRTKDNKAIIDKRTYRLKDPALEFICPLCGTPRAFQLRPRLSKKNYLQMVLTSMVLVLATFPLMEFMSFIFFFIVWAIFEGSVRVLFRKEVPCPHCGFDASWYHRDVKVAKRMVQEFWGPDAYQVKNQKVEKAGNLPPNLNQTSKEMGEDSLSA